MDIAWRVSEQSIDPHRKVGAIIANKDQIIAYGWNGTPYGYYTNECKDENGKTLKEVVHAEMNAIAKAASSTTTTDGATLYVTTVPCVECAKMIIQSGINFVIYEEEYSCSRGKDLLKECGVQIFKIQE